MKSLILAIVFALFLIAGIFALNEAGPDRQAQALSGSQFKAGNIISDSNFFNGSALSEERVQQFLDAQVPTCDTDGSEIYSGSTTRAQYGTSKGHPPPYTCLKSYKQAIPDIAAEAGLCSGLNSTAGSKVSAAEIIYKAGKSCGVSQKVLLVLLQKEQSLVTDTWPWDTQYTKATGYACPDTSSCNPAYAGFVKQVYYGARQYKLYAKNPDNYNHIAGETNSIRYSPKAGCGSKNVYITNQATAGLYNYTPYTPNKAALDNLRGTGDSCSAYGNRNFWRLYNDWFGSTLTEALPIVTLVGDWSGSPAQEVGFKRGNQYYYDFDNDGIADKNFGIGKVTDKALVGDWDGDGKDEVGLRRGNLYFYDNNNDGTADVSFGIGRTTDSVIVGDWNGDGTDSIGLKRGNLYFYDNNYDGIADVSFGIGRTTDKTIVGDWDSNGADSVGLKRYNRYYYDNNSDGMADVSFILDYF